MDHYRKDLEQVILGACLLENGYNRVAGILSFKNFTPSSTYNHQLIFQSIQNLYPSSPIDILTVTHKIKKLEYSSYLAYCMNKVCNVANLRFHAFILLQESMRSLLVERLNMAMNMELKTVTKAHINDIVKKCLDPYSDIVKFYDLLPDFLKSVNAEESLIKEMTNLKNDLYEKTIRIKKQAHIDCLFNNLQRLPEGTLDSKSKLCMTHLINVIKGILVTEGIDDKTATKILDI